VNGRFVKAALDAGFDLPVYKTVRTRRWASHGWPNVLAVEAHGNLHPTTNRLRGHSDYSSPLSITNSFGVPSFDPEIWQPDLASAVAYARPGQVVIGSFQGTQPEHGGVKEYIGDFALGARLMRETGVKIAEVNLSCPNEGTANLLCFDADRARAVVEAIKTELGDVALVAKIAYFAQDAALQRLVEAIGAMLDAFEAINTIPAEVVDGRGEQALPGAGRLRSGVCGAGIRWAGLEMTERLVRLRQQLDMRYAVVGVGGVSSAADYGAYRAAGADAVMSATGAMWNPLLAQQVKHEMLEPAHA
jgi:dihydroorotate dehydrogenase